MNRMKALANNARLVITAGGLSLIVAVAAFLIARGLSDSGGQAVADLGPQPPEAPSISSPWPDLSGRVLHWQNYNYFFAPGSPDGANGREIRGDIWLRVGPENKPIALRGTFTYSDGSFHQEYLYVDGRALIVHDEPIQTSQGESGEPVCRLDKALDDATFASLVDPGEPVFASPSRIEAAGFAPGSQVLVERASLDPASLGAISQGVFGDTGAVVQVWTRETTLEDGTTSVDTLQVGEQGWLAADVHTVVASDGSEMLTTRRAFTPIELFSGSDAEIESVFDPSTLSEGCSA